MDTTRRFPFLPSLLSGTLLLLAATLGQRASAADAMSPLDLRHVKVGGEIGRRIHITIDNNILVLDRNNFLPPFQRKISNGDGTGSDLDAAYIGLGKLMAAAIELAANTGHAKLIVWKERLIHDTIAMQQADGYLGIMTPSHRMWTLWDIHEMSYLILALTKDYRLLWQAVVARCGSQNGRLHAPAVVYNARELAHGAHSLRSPHALYRARIRHASRFTAKQRTIAI